MKYLKIILLFVVFVGAIVLVMNWKSIVNSESGGEDFSTKDQIDIKGKCSNFREQWTTAKSWDQKLYDRQSGQVEAWKSQNYLSSTGYNTLSTVVREQAVRKIDKSYKALLTPETYNHNKLVEVYKGVGYMKSKEKNIDADFLEIDGIHSLYLKIKAFTQSGSNISPSFNSETGTWPSFTAKQNQILSTAASYRGNKYYSQLKEIPGFQDGLNADRLKKTTDGMKPGYYKKLSDIIATAINNATPDKESYDRMKRVYENFAEESPQNSKIIYQALNNLEKRLPTE